MFATAQIVQGEIPNAFLIPQAALTRTPTGQAMAMLVGADNKVTPRPVTTVGTQGSNWIVTEGLNPGDKVIVDGIAKVKPEQQVVPKPYQPQAAAPQGAAQPAAQQPAADAKRQMMQRNNLNKTCCQSIRSKVYGSIFIHRPIFAWVIALVIMLAGILTISKMPIAQYPTIAPPTVTISATYPGASAATVENTVTQIIEQQMNGLDGLRYISSNSAGNGQASIALNFEQGVDPDIAQVQVQNKLQSATALLPEDVQRQGVRVTKSGASFLQVLAFYSPDGSMTADDIKDYVNSNISEPLSRVAGVGEVQVFGGSYAMRIWLDPAKMASLQVTPSDIATAIRTQNAQVAVGQLGGAPAVEGQVLNATVTAQSLLQTPEQFSNIFLKNTTSGAQVRLGDVARVELGADNYQFDSKFNGKPAGGVAIKLATGANAEAVEERLEQLRPNYPQGMVDTLAFDTTPFIQLSIESVVHTLIEAVILVFIVMFLFLQNWRATIIPTMAVPVVVLGTFAVINVFGFSINTLTMFAMVLAIGLLVDDAIVVVENVERVMVEEHLDPVSATEKSMKQISGALIGITSVLSAVFVPMAFFGGTTGVIYRQFSITLVTAMVLSLIVALTFTLPYVRPC